MPYLQFYGYMQEYKEQDNVKGGVRQVSFGIADLKQFDFLKNDTSSLFSDGGWVNVFRFFLKVTMKIKNENKQYL